MAKGKSRDGSKEAFWRSMIERHRQSGLSIREFCRREKLSEPSFYAWRREIARRDAQSRIVPKRPRRRRKASFVPVRLATETAPSGGRIEIELSRDRRIHLTSPIDRQALADVLAVLEGATC